MVSPLVAIGRHVVSVGDEAGWSGGATRCGGSLCGADRGRECHAVGAGRDGQEQRASYRGRSGCGCTQQFAPCAGETGTVPSSETEVAVTVPSGAASPRTMTVAPLVRSTRAVSACDVTDAVSGTITFTVAPAAVVR